jgi:organic radical activating enzyme
VKRINFTGGEPLLIKENIAVLEELIRLDNTDCELLITTNASVINNKIVELVKHFDRVHWTISLDAVSHVAEYVRNGTVWPTLVNNIKQILSTRQSVGFNTVLSAYSVLDINNLLVFFKNLKIEYADQPLEIWFSICQDPFFLNPTVLNDGLKQTAIEQLQQAIDILSTIDNNPERSIQTLKSLQNNLNECIMNTSSYDTFVNYTMELDQIRNQNFEETFGVKL